jgi:hypothetical protein
LRERERERERELRELRGIDTERSAHKKALLEILWCDDYQDSLHGVWNSLDISNPRFEHRRKSRAAVVEKSTI